MGNRLEIILASYTMEGSKGTWLWEDGLYTRTTLISLRQSHLSLILGFPYKQVLVSISAKFIAAVRHQRMPNYFMQQANGYIDIHRKWAGSFPSLLISLAADNYRQSMATASRWLFSSINIMIYIWRSSYLEHAQVLCRHTTWKCPLFALQSDRSRIYVCSMIALTRQEL